MDFEFPDHPLDPVEAVLDAQDWSYRRTNPDLLHAQVPGQWRSYQLAFGWWDDPEVLQMVTHYGLQVEESHRGKVSLLITRMNERTGLGHFEMWHGDGSVLFRYALPLAGASGPTPEQVDTLLSMAVSASDWFYPAFQLVLEGVEPDDAFSAATLEAQGEA